MPPQASSVISPASDPPSALVTLRSGADRPGALTALWKDGLTERVELEGLSRRETSELVTAVLGATVEEATVERIWQLTDGNPLYVHEVLLSTARPVPCGRAKESGAGEGRSRQARGWVRSSPAARPARA